jgi:hypothetical protein
MFFVPEGLVKRMSSVVGLAFFRADFMITSDTTSELFGLITRIFMA